jgi:hypothetical protein
MKRKKTTRRRTPRRGVARTRRKDPGAALAAFARRIVEVTTAGGDALSHLTLYSPDVVSVEPSFPPAHGLEGLAEKARSWQQMQEAVTWEARSVCLDPRAGTICIEWNALVKLRGGPTVPISEVAIHHVKNGKIVAERFYYDPSGMTPA